MGNPIPVAEECTIGKVIVFVNFLRSAGKDFANVISMSGFTLGVPATRQ
jgi:hypothetical protein